MTQHEIYSTEAALVDCESLEKHLNESGMPEALVHRVANLAAEIRLEREIRLNKMEVSK